jgi:hypothetical protein
MFSDAKATVEREKDESLYGRSPKGRSMIVVVSVVANIIGREELRSSSQTTYNQNLTGKIGE